MDSSSLPESPPDTLELLCSLHRITAYGAVLVVNIYLLGEMLAPHCDIFFTELGAVT